MSQALRLSRALIWLRWRSLVNLLRFSGRRGAGAAVSAWGGAAVRVFLGGLALVMALALAIGAGFAVWALAGGAGAAGDQARGIALLAPRLAFGILSVVVVIFAVLGGSRGGGSGGNLVRLLLLPVSSRQLHATELAAALADPVLLVAMPAMLVLGFGTAVLRPSGAAPALLAVALLAATLAALATAASFAAQILLRDRRRAELAAVLAVVVWLAVSVLPSALNPGRGERPKDDPAAEQPAAAEGVGRVAETFPLWFQPAPSEAFALTLAGAWAGDQGRAWRGAATLALELAALYGLSLVLWRRLVASPASASGRRGGIASPLPGLRAPGLTGAAAAVAWATVRSFWRTVQGKLALVMPALSLLVAALALRQVEFAGQAVFATAWGGAALAIAAVALSLLSQQSVLSNQFAVDGAGLTRELVCPLSDRDLLLGKAAGGAVLTAAAMMPALLVGATLLRGPSPLLWPAAALLAGLGAYALLAPLVAWLSMLLPKAVDLSRVGQGGKPHGGAALIGFAALPFALMPPAALGALALAGWGSPTLLLLVEALWLVVAVAAAWFFLRFSESLLARRREAILLTIHDRG